MEPYIVSYTLENFVKQIFKKLLVYISKKFISFFTVYKIPLILLLVNKNSIIIVTVST